MLLVAACAGGDSDSADDDGGATGAGPGDETDDSDDDDGIEEEDDDAPDREGYELTVWLGRDGVIPADNFESFLEDHPGVSINLDIVPYEDVVAQYIRSYNAGNAPDIVNIDGNSLAALASPGMVKDIGGLIALWAEENPEHYDSMLPGAFDFASWEGTEYGLSNYNWGEFYMYRMDLLSEAGWDEPPATWDEVIEVARATTTGDVSGFTQIFGRGQGCQTGIMTMFMAMGGEHDADGVMMLDSEPGVYFLSFVQTMMGEGLIDPANLSWDSGDKRAAFINGNASQGIISPTIPPLIDENYTFGEEFGITRPPSRDGEGYRHKARSNVLLVSEQTEDADLAVRFLRYMGSVENLREVGARYLPPANSEVWEFPEFDQPWNEVMAPAYAELDVQPIHPRQPEIDDICLDAVGEAAQNPEADPVEIAREHQQAIDDLLGR